MTDNRRTMLLHNEDFPMATESTDESTEERERPSRRELVQLLVKHDMERHADIYDELARE